MLLRLAARYLLRTVAVLTLGASFAGGCSRQGEGERCDLRKAGGDGDCDSGLVCKLCTELQDGTTDRCCPPGTQYSDSRCQPGSSNTCGTGTGGTGTGGTSASGGAAGDDGNSETGGTGGITTGGTAGTESGGSAGTGISGGDAGGQAGDTAAGG